MQLPVDVKGLIDAATDIKSARQTKLSVSVYVDETAPAELTAHMRSTFASTVPTVRMAISYLDRTFLPQPTDDIAIVVAGESAKVPAAAAALRAVGVPTMIVCLSPTDVAARAEKEGNAIPDGDLVAPYESDEGREEPFALDEEAAAALNDRMGRWIVDVCRDKRLAYAIAFPFMRRPLARDAVQATSMQNAGIGLVPLIPGADLPIMTLNQAKMALQIAAAYGHEMDKDRAKELAAVVGGAYLCRTLARELVEFVPILGFAVRAGVAYGGTAAVGYAIVDYFEGGENASGVANVASRAVETGSKFVEGVRQTLADPAASPIVKRVREIVPQVREQVDTYVPVAMDMVNEYGPKVMNAVNEYVPKVVDKASGLVSQAVASAK